MLRPCRFTPFHSLSTLALDSLPSFFLSFLFLFSPSSNLVSGSLKIALPSYHVHSPSGFRPAVLLFCHNLRKFLTGLPKLYQPGSPTLVSNKRSYNRSYRSDVQYAVINTYIQTCSFQNQISKTMGFPKKKSLMIIKLPSGLRKSKNYRNK